MISDDAKFWMGAISAVIFVSLARWVSGWAAAGFFVLYIVTLITYYALKLRNLRRNHDA